MLERAVKALDQKLYGSQVELNELLKVRFENRERTEVSLHIASAKERKERISAEEKDTPTRKAIGNTRGLWRDALIKLAKLVNENPQFKDVQAITFTTWLPRLEGYRHMLESLGFHVDIYDEKYWKGAMLRWRNSARNVVMRDIPEKYQDLKPCFTELSRTELLARFGFRSPTNES